MLAGTAAIHLVEALAAGRIAGNGAAWRGGLAGADLLAVGFPSLLALRKAGVFIWLSRHQHAGRASGLSAWASGAMQLPGPGVFGPRPDPGRSAGAFLRRAVESGVGPASTPGAVLWPRRAGQRADPRRPAPLPRGSRHRLQWSGPDATARVSGSRHSDPRSCGRSGGQPGPFGPGTGTGGESAPPSRIFGATRRADGHHGGPARRRLDRCGRAEQRDARGVQPGVGATPVACVQNAYSVADRSGQEVFDACRTDGVPYVPFFPLGSAFMPDRPVLTHPAVVAVAERLGHSPAQIALAWLLGGVPPRAPHPGHVFAVATSRRTWPRPVSCSIRLRWTRWLDVALAVESSSRGVGRVRHSARVAVLLERNPGVRATVSAVATGPDLSKIWLFSTATAKERRGPRPGTRRGHGEARASPLRGGHRRPRVLLHRFRRGLGPHNNRKVRTLGPGQYFGELALIDRQPRSATVVADTEMDLLVLAQREFNSVLVTMPELSRKMMIAPGHAGARVRQEGRGEHLRSFTAFGSNRRALLSQML